MPEVDNPFWTFSVSVYGEPGVADECLALQDAFGIDVNILLFCVWAGVDRGLIISAADFRALNDAVRDWQDAVVKPLRAIRRKLKLFASNDAAVAALRADVIRDELKAEQIEHALLYAMVGRLAGKWAEPTEAVRRNVAAAIASQPTEGNLALQYSNVVTHCPLLVRAAARTA